MRSLLESVLLFVGVYGVACGLLFMFLPTRLVSSDYYQVLAVKVAQSYQLDPVLFRALVTHESNWNPYAVSAKGAAGLTQLMPATAWEVCGLTSVERFYPYDNLDCGARYFAAQLARFGSVELALAAYNAGPERVARVGRVPMIPETQQYVKRIVRQWQEGI